MMIRPSNYPLGQDRPLHLDSTNPSTCWFFSRSPFFEKTGGEETFYTMRNVFACWQKKSMSDKTLTFSIFFAPRDFGDVRCRQNSAGQNMLSAADLGRSSIASGDHAFRPCLIAFSPSGYQSPALFLSLSPLALGRMR